MTVVVKCTVLVSMLLRVPSSALANALQLRSIVYISVRGCVHEHI